MFLFENFARKIRRLNLVLPKKDRQVLFSFLLFISLVLIVFETPTGWLELKIIDLKNRVYGHLVYQQPSEEFLVLAIDAGTLENAPHSWPWPNSYWAEIINHITQKSQPNAIVIDVYFSDKKDAETDPVEPLAKAIRANGKIGLVSVFHETILTSGVQLQINPPEKHLKDAAAFWGLTQQKIDLDGKTRSFLLHDQRIKKKHLAWELQNFLNLPLPDTKLFFSSPKTETLLALRHPARGFPRVSLIDLVTGKVDPATISGKTLIIGATAPVLHDFHETSLGLVTGPDILAGALQTLRHKRLQIFRPGIWQRLCYYFLGLAVWLLMVSDIVRRPITGFVLFTLLLPLLLFALSFYCTIYPPIGLAFITFLGASLTSFALHRIIIASEIRESLHEAEICGKIQQAFFPKKMLEHQSGITCSGLCIPFQNAGGDYYDFFQLENGNIFFILGDVSGHGISASMLTTSAKTVVALQRDEKDFSLTGLYEKLNKIIITLTAKKMMMTASAGLIDFELKRVSLISAGHLPAILRQETEIEEFAVPGFPLGVVAKYKSLKLLEFALPETGFLVLYSDGIIEGLNWKNEQYGFDRMNATVKSISNTADGNEVISSLCRDLNQHTEGRPYEDDVTFLVINFNRKIQEDL